MTKVMPVHSEARRELRRLGVEDPESWPMEPFLDPRVEEQCRFNHGQSAARLAERGGLAPSEALAVLTSEKWKPMDEALALRCVAAYVDARTWRAPPRTPALTCAHCQKKTPDEELGAAREALAAAAEALRGAPETPEVTRFLSLFSLYQEVRGQRS